MSGPLQKARQEFNDADRGLVAVLQTTARRWNDAAYRRLDSQVLRPVQSEARRFDQDLAEADHLLARAMDLIRM